MLFAITKTKIRIIYWGGFILLMVLIVFPLFFFFYLFNENKVREAIIDGFDGKNYNVEIYGGVIPKLWHGMSLDINGVLITNKAGDELIRIRQMGCKLSWLDLIIGRYSVNRIAINGMEVNTRNILSLGSSNLLNGSFNKRQSIFNIENLSIKGISSFGANQKYKFDDGSLNVEQNGIGANFNFGVKLGTMYYLLNGATSLVDGVIIFNSFNLHLYNNFTNVNLSSNANYDLQAQQLNLSNLSGNISIKNYVGDIGINSATLGFESASINNLFIQLGSTNNLLNKQLLVSAKNIRTIDYKNFLINQLHNQYKSNFTNINFNLDSKFESMVYLESRAILSNNCMNKLNLDVPNSKLVRLSANLNGECSYGIGSQLFSFNLNGDINNSPAKLRVKFDDSGDKPYLILDGSLSSLDLSKIDFNDKGQSIFAELNKLPFSWFDVVDGKANLLIDKFLLNQVALNQLHTKFGLADNKLHVESFTANVYNGKVVGNLDVIKNQDKYDVYTKQTMSGLSLESMLADYFNVNTISGTANLDLKVQALGVENYTQILKKITGDVAINAQNGAFQGVDFNLFVNPSATSLSTNRSTIFNKMKASFKFKDGVSNGGLLEFSSPYVIADGSGRLNFVQNTLDYDLRIKSALPKNEQKISLVVIPVSISGDILSPKINIQHIQLIEGKTLTSQKSRKNRDKK